MRKLETNTVLSTHVVFFRIYVVFLIFLLQKNFVSQLFLPVHHILTAVIFLVKSALMTSMLTKLQVFSSLKIIFII